ncbi:MAG: hypothetical protein U1A27_03090 [Phycisphaerae bacterium]
MTATSNQAGAPATGDRPRRGGPLAGGLGVIVALVALGVAGYLVVQMFRQPPASDTVTSQEPVFVCSETLKSFNHRLRDGERPPVYSPHSKKSTGWPAERCYWTKDGNAKLEPTYVLLNEYVGKPGPTHCPDCGREVVPHNPMPPSEKMAAARK